MCIMENRSEFIGQIIEVFESFLDKRKIILQNEEKEDAIKEVEDADEIANIYGSDYGELQTEIEYILDKWNISTSYIKKGALKASFYFLYFDFL